MKIIKKCYTDLIIGQHTYNLPEWLRGWKKFRILYIKINGISWLGFKAKGDFIDVPEICSQDKKIEIFYI